MIVILIVLAPVFALLIWGVIFDLKRRRRTMTSHDIGKAANRIRGQHGPTDAGG
jgi:hypothetical protein